MEGHVALHLLDGAAEATDVPQWRPQRLWPCPSRRRGAQCCATISWTGSVHLVDVWVAVSETTAVPTIWTYRVEGVAKGVRGRGRGQE